MIKNFSIAFFEEELIKPTACRVVSADCFVKDTENTTQKLSMLGPGEVAVMTDSNTKQAKFVVTVPDVRTTVIDSDKESQPTRYQEWHLRMAYLGSCYKAEQLGMEKLVFNLLGVGNHAMSLTDGVHIALQTIFAFVETNPNTCLQTFVFAIPKQEWLRVARKCLWYMGVPQHTSVLNFSSKDARQHRLQLELVTTKSFDFHKKCRIPVLGSSRKLKVASYASYPKKNSEEKKLIKKGLINCVQMWTNNRKSNQTACFPAIFSKEQKPNIMT